MGVDRRVTFDEGRVPAWSALAALLAQRQFRVHLAMIDGQLSLPDEMLADTWRELRVQTPAGMITLRREPGAIAVVTWGNAAGPLLQAWNALTWAVAEASAGRIVSDSQSQSAAEFLAQAELPAGFK